MEQRAPLAAKLWQKVVTSVPFPAIKAYCVTRYVYDVVGLGKSFEGTKKNCHVVRYSLQRVYVCSALQEPSCPISNSF